MNTELHITTNLDAVIKHQLAIEAVKSDTTRFSVVVAQFRNYYRSKCASQTPQALASWSSQLLS